MENEKLNIGQTVIGSIYKDDALLYENKKFTPEENTLHQTFEAKAAQIQLYDENKPLLKVNEKCRLVLNDGRELNIQVINISELPSSLYMVLFYLKQPY